MAIEIIDLTSDAEEDESPTKTFTSFKPRKQTREEQAFSKARQSSNNNIADTAPQIQSSGRASAVHPSKISNRASPFHSSPPSNGNGTAEELVNGERPLKSAEDFLSKATQDALGTPGRSLNMELTNIDRKLRTSIGQTEALRQGRVANTDIFHKRRTSSHMASKKSQSARTPTPVTGVGSSKSMDNIRAEKLSGLAPSQTSERPEGGKGFFSRYHPSHSRMSEQERRNKWASQETSNGYRETVAAPTVPQSSTPVLSGPGIAIQKIQPAQHIQPAPAKNDFKRPHSRLSSDRSPLPAAKRPCHEAASLSGVVPNANSTTRERTISSSQKQQIQPARPLVLNDVTNDSFQRISYSDEPETVPSSSQASNAELTQSAFSSLPRLTQDKTRAPQPVASLSRFGQEYSADEDARIKRLKEVNKVSWQDMAKHFPGRTAASLQSRYSSKLKSLKSLKPVTIPIPAGPSVASSPLLSNLPQRSTVPANPTRPSVAVPSPLVSGSRTAMRYTDEDDALIRKLKEVDKVKFEDMLQYFPGRAAASLSVRYYTKSKFIPLPQSDVYSSVNLLRTDSQEQQEQPWTKRQRRTAPTATDGFISWAAAKSLMRGGPDVANVEDLANTIDETPNNLRHLLKQDTAEPHTVSQLLRRRELGSTGGARSWTSTRCTAPAELKNHAFSGHTLEKFYQGTSGDVVSLCWSASGKSFAAGSIAITDAQSQQYNMSRNLLVGDIERSELQELPDHHVPRPIVGDANNVNALHSMRQSQDPRLFLTVTSTAFSPVRGSEHWLFTAGTDKMLRRYSVGDYSPELRSGVERTKCDYAVEHPATVDLLAMHQDGMVATGCHIASESIRVYSCGDQGYQSRFVGSPNRSDLATSVPIYPSALKWGEHYVHRQYLLAGFSGDEDKQLAGETALWDVEHERRLDIVGITRNVSDLCWNPIPSAASVAFAVASNSSGLNIGKGMRSAVQCFAPTDSGIKKVIAWQCPALDINDLVFCPHDDNLVAAGATNGKVYIWDKRWVDQHQRPWHVLSHSSSLNVLPHDRSREEADTGVRFLSWGTTKTRLFSGSSDGIVKIWNPYRAEGNAHIDDILVPRQHRSAVMSGAFSPDHRHLLIGTENGRINSFKVGGGAAHRARSFKLHTAPTPVLEAESASDRAQALVKSRKIEYRPCGAMPIRQAVQGSNYQGPYLAFPADELRQADARLRSAQQEQNELEARLTQQGLSHVEDEAVIKAQRRVQEAQAAMTDLQDRQDFAEASRPKAVAFQSSLLAAEQQRRALERQAAQRFGKDATPCALSCAYLPNADEVDDSNRSVLRIPGLLTSVSSKVLIAARSAREEGEDADTCRFCDPSKPSVRNGTWRARRCLSCTLKQLGLSTECARCAAPASVETGAGKAPLCESCRFACFRCSQPAVFSPDTRLVVCHACDITWEAGVLGYEIVNFPRQQVVSCNSPRDSSKNSDEDIGTLERERLASRFDVGYDALYDIH